MNEKELKGIFNIHFTSKYHLLIRCIIIRYSILLVIMIFIQKDHTETTL